MTLGTGRVYIMNETLFGKTSGRETMKIIVCIITFCGIGAVPGLSCSPEYNCKSPDCRCFTENAIPGGLAPKDVPQMVVVTMDYALNSEYNELYDQMFQTINPNDCPAVGTFFLQDQYTDYDIVKSYYDRGFEIGISSTNGKLPTSTTEWINMIKSVKNRIVSAGIKSEDIRGYRSPQLAFGGNAEFVGIGNNNLVYDAGCVTSEYDTESTFKWPFTYDHVPGVNCNGQSAPIDRPFPGKWQILIPDIKFDQTICEVPQGCANVRTKKDAFDLLYDNFVEHYEGDRTPYFLIIDPEWIITDFKRDGTVEFLHYIRAAFQDVYLVTVWQMLQWVNHPTPIANITSFHPWSCHHQQDVVRSDELRYRGRNFFEEFTMKEKKRTSMK